MKIIIEGNPSEVNKIVRENAVRVRRGLISIAPISEDSEDAAPIIDDDKTVVIDSDKKEPKKGRKNKVIED